MSFSQRISAAPLPFAGAFAAVLLWVAPVAGQADGAVPARSAEQPPEAASIRSLLAPPDPIAAFTQGMRSQEGFLPVHLDPETGKLFLEVARLDEDILYTNALATGIGSTRTFRLDPGAGGDMAVVRFERHGPRIFLVRQNTGVFASSGDTGEIGGVEKSFPVSVLTAMPIVEQDGGRFLVDATEFLLSDVWGVRGAIRGAGLGELELDREKGYFIAEFTKAFPENSEIRTALTFTAEDPHSEIQRHTPDGRFLTIQQHHSFLMLPEEPMDLRVFDPRTGNSAVVLQDYSEGFDGDYRKRYVERWRLEKRDPDAAISEPIEPIVYYLDPAIPEPYRTAYTRGVLWWNEIFEAAGFRNAIQVRDLPEGADPMDARYSVIQLVNRSTPGASVGGGRSDPRTGEILKAMPRMDSHRSITDYNIYAGLLPAFDALGIEPQLTAEEFVMARRMQHAAHEVGHSLGFPHNFISTAQGRSSVMGYPFPRIRLDDEGNLDISDAYRLSGGYSDTLSVRYAYTQFDSPEAEAEGLRAIVQEALERGHLSMADGGIANSYPEISRWIDGPTAFDALEQTMEVRRVLLEHFDERAIRPGEPLAWLNPRFAQVYLHHRYAAQAIVKYVGGMQFTYAMRGDGQTPTRVIPAAEQRRALDLVMELLSTAELAVPERVVELIPPPPPGYREPPGWINPAGVSLPPAVASHGVWIESPGGSALDPLAIARSFAQEVVDNLLRRERMARLVSFQFRDPDQLSLHEVLGRLVDGTWGAPGPRTATQAAYRRAAERAVLDGLFTLAADEQATAAVRDAASRQLALLGEALTTGPLAFAGGTGQGDLAEDLAHRGRARREIERFLEYGEIPALRTGVIQIPLPWP